MSGKIEKAIVNGVEIDLSNGRDVKLSPYKNDPNEELIHNAVQDMVSYLERNSNLVEVLRRSENEQSFVSGLYFGILGALLKSMFKEKDTEND